MDSQTDCKKKVKLSMQSVQDGDFQIASNKTCFFLLSLK